MRQYGSEGEAEGDDLVICEKVGSESVLVKGIVFGILNDEEGTEWQLGIVFGTAIRYVRSSDPLRN